MAKFFLQEMRASAYRIVFAQLGLVLFILTILAIFYPLTILASACWGGLTCVLANGVFARRIFTATGASQCKVIMKAFYLGGLQKIALTILLFFIAIKFLNIVFLPFLLMYIAAQISFCFASIITQR